MSGFFYSSGAPNISIVGPYLLRVYAGGNIESSWLKLYR